MNVLLLTVFGILYFGISLYVFRGVKLKVKDICISGIVIAITIVLENIKIPLPTGATLPCASMVPLMVMAITYDYKVTFYAGLSLGVISMALIPGWQPVHPGQIIAEHLVCFSCLAYAGIFKSLKKQYVLFGILIAGIIKLTGHVISGVLFFSENAWDGIGAWGYSLAYNISQTVPLTIISAIVVMVLPLKNIKTGLKKD